MKKKFSDKYILKVMLKFIVFDAIIAGMLIVIIVFILPFLIWNLGTKEFMVEDKVLQVKDIDPISTSNKKIYVKESSTDNKKSYTINMSNNLVYLDSNSAEIVESDSIKDPEYMLVAQYKINELKSDNIITRNVNDMYANINLEQSKAVFIGSKVKIYVPKNSVEK